MTESTQIRLPKTGSADVTFTGREIARSDGSGPEHARWHELTVYAMEPQGYALSIRYHTNWQGEQGRDDVLVSLADQTEIVTELLARHDPIAAVQGYPSGEQYAEKQRRLLDDIRSRYDHQVSELLRRAEITTDAAKLSTMPIPSLDLRRYRDLMSRALADLTLTRGEACLICDALNGTALFGTVDEHDGTYMFIPAEIEDSIRLDGTDEKWSVDGKTLVRKLHELPPVILCAIADACERFWQHPHRDLDERLREVGLTS